MGQIMQFIPFAVKRIRPLIWLAYSANAMLALLGMKRAISIRGIAILVSTLALILACSGLDFTTPTFENATIDEVKAAGYKVPDHSTDISIKDFSQIDIRSTWYAFTLPAAEFDKLQQQYASEERYTSLPSWEVPSSRPDYSRFGTEGTPPSWWSPTGETVFRLVHSAGDPSGSKDMGSGLQVAFDNQNRRVHLWRWQFQFWQDSP